MRKVVLVVELGPELEYGKAMTVTVIAMVNSNSNRSKSRAQERNSASKPG